MYQKISVLFDVFAILILAASANVVAESEWTIHKVTLNGQEYKIPNKIINGGLSDLIVDIDFKQMTILLSDAGEGIMEISIPRQMVDSKSDGKDDLFLVFVDGEDANFKETRNTQCFRTLSIEFPEGTEEIEIIGSRLSAVPSLYVTTDKQNYESGETIEVSGCTNLALDDKEVVLEVINPAGKLYKTIAVTPDTDGSFSTSLVVEGEDAIDGTYTAEATYAGESASSTFVVPEFPIAMIITSIAIGLMLGIMRLRRGKILQH